MLEELKAAYGTEYTLQPIHLPKAIQKQPWYLKINPAGKIPALVDHDNGASLGESGGKSCPDLVHITDPSTDTSLSDPPILGPAL